MTLLLGLYFRNFGGNITVSDGDSKTSDCLDIPRPFTSLFLGLVFEIITLICMAETFRQVNTKDLEKRKEIITSLNLHIQKSQNIHSIPNIFVRALEFGLETHFYAYFYA